MPNFKWNIGDKLIVRHDLANTAVYHVDDDDAMVGYCGSVVTIHSRFENWDYTPAYYIEEDDQEWRWGETDFIPLLKVGDRVTVRPDLEIDDLVHVVDEMLEYRGREAVVTRVLGDNYLRIDIDGGSWNWNPTDFVSEGTVIVVKSLAMSDIFQHFKNKY